MTKMVSLLAKILTGYAIKTCIIIVVFIWLVLIKVVLLSPHPGWYEIDPEKLWETVVKVIKNAIEGEISSLLLLTYAIF